MQLQSPIIPNSACLLRLWRRQWRYSSTTSQQNWAKRINGYDSRELQAMFSSYHITCLDREVGQRQSSALSAESFMACDVESRLGRDVTVYSCGA